MMVAFLALLVLGGPAAPTDPSAMVAGLGSTRAAERAAAAAALEQLGPDAIPALREARQARDLELRVRAAALLDAIEGRALAAPTLVTLDFHDRPIAEVVAAIADRSKTELILEPESEERWKTERISLEESTPLALWEALDRLCAAGGLRLLVGPEQTGFRGINRFAPVGGFPQRPRTGHELILVANDLHAAPPVANSGAVQVVLLSLHHQRDRVFISSLPARATTAAPGAATVRFTIRVEVRLEPRLTLLWVGTPERLEAIDDRGQSLPPESFPFAPRPPSQSAGTVPRSGLLDFGLKYPERPGKTIQWLRGTLPLQVAGRRPDPLVAPLEGSRDQVFRAGETTLSIHDVKALPDRRGSVVELTLTAPGLAGPGTSPIWPTDARAGLRPPPLSLPQLDFVDAQGRVCQSFAPGPYRLGDGTRKTLQVQCPEGTGPPVEVRYHEISWTRVDVPFAFANLPMP